MKNKLFYVLIVITVLLLAGCKNNDQETYFVPTPAPDILDEDENPNDNIDGTDDKAQNSENYGENAGETSGEEPVVTGETTTKYVKLNTFGAILNVRSSPTTEEDNVVGFLVHTEPVEVISIEDGWASFMYKGQVCYVSAEYLVDFVPLYISPPTPEQ